MAVLSNGASRVVDRFGLLEWADLAAADPAVLLRMVATGGGCGACQRGRRYRGVLAVVLTLDGAR